MESASGLGRRPRLTAGLGPVRSVDVIAFFAKRGREGNARKIVSPLLNGSTRELRLEYPVTDEIPATDPQYRRAIADFYVSTAQALAAELKQGLSVGLLAEGDPFFYGSFMHMWHRLESAFPIEVVPGVTACRDAGHGQTHPSPGATMFDGDARHASRGDFGRTPQPLDATVILKVGRNLAKVRRAVEAAGLLDRAILCGTRHDGRRADQSAVRAQRETGPYFAMVLIPGRGRRL